MMIKLTPVHVLVTYKFPEFAEFNERSKSMQIYRQKQIRNLHIPYCKKILVMKSSKNVPYDFFAMIYCRCESYRVGLN